MEFHLEFTPSAFAQKINHRDKLLLIGSCFTENIGNKLKQLKFSVLENPNGILFNPISIVKALQSYIDNTTCTATDIFYQNECWNSWDHHSRFSHPQQEECLQLINQSRQAAHGFLKNTNWIMITLGSAFVYERDNADVVANCHKVPTDKFHKKLLSSTEITEALKKIRTHLFDFNPSLKIIFTISPVRHLRDGFVENNRSKAALIQAVHELVDGDKRLYYFPAYELVIDDLRDYRFYAEDMVHPNYAATNYVWNKFVNACIDEPSQLLMKEINTLNAAKNHKPFNPEADLHKKFMQTCIEKTRQLQLTHPYINFGEEINFFSGIPSAGDEM